MVLGEVIMSDKKHQTHETSYEIQVDGQAVYRPNVIGKVELNKYTALRKKYPNSHVGIVRLK